MGLFHLHSNQPQIVLLGCYGLKVQGITVIYPCRELDSSKLEYCVWQTVFLLFVDFLESVFKIATIDSDKTILNAWAYLPAEEEIQFDLILARRLHTGLKYELIFPLTTIDTGTGYRHQFIQFTALRIEQEDIVLVQWRVGSIEQPFGKGVDHTALRFWLCFVGQMRMPKRKASSFVRVIGDDI